MVESCFLPILDSFFAYSHTNWAEPPSCHWDDLGENLRKTMCLPKWFTDGFAVNLPRMRLPNEVEVVVVVAAAVVAGGGGSYGCGCDCCCCDCCCCC